MLRVSSNCERTLKALLPEPPEAALVVAMVITNLPFAAARKDTEGSFGVENPRNWRNLASMTDLEGGERNAWQNRQLRRKHMCLHSCQTLQISRPNPSFFLRRVSFVRQKEHPLFKFSHFCSSGFKSTLSLLELSSTSSRQHAQRHRS